MPSALPYEAYHRKVWRLVEGQFRPSTMRIVDTIEEQELLEGILEDTKPPVPEECRHLSYLFWSPFRYGCYPTDSRFRRRGRTPGVYYASENAETAVAEVLWKRLAVFAASPGTPLPRNPLEHTAIQAEIQAVKSLDLTTPPLNGQSAGWTDPTDYSACLDLADEVRADGGECIRYMSVRDPGSLANLAVLTCHAFAAPEPVRYQTWRIMLRPNGGSALCESPRLALEFQTDGTRFAGAAVA